jgi:hypothetical protein
MQLIKAKEAKQIADVNNREYNDEIEILNVLIKDAAEHGLCSCEVNIKLMSSVLSELDKAGYSVYSIDLLDERDEGEKIYYVLYWGGDFYEKLYSLRCKRNDVT